MLLKGILAVVYCTQINDKENLALPRNIQRVKRRLKTREKKKDDRQIDRLIDRRKKRTTEKQEKKIKIDEQIN